MPDELSQEDILSKLEGFFSEAQFGYGPRFIELTDKYPDIRSVDISWKDLDLYDSDLAEYLLSHPNDIVERAKDVIRGKVFESGKKIETINIRIKSLPQDASTDVRALRAKHVGRLISVQGLVRKATDVRPKLLHAAFECVRCHHIIVEKQESHELQEPLECYKDQGGCGKLRGQTQFLPKTEVSELLDTQKLEIQERLEGLRGGAQPQRLSCWLEDDICGKIMVGDRVTLNGILRTYIRDSRQKKTQLEIYLDTKSYETEEKELEDIDITEEDEREILETGNDPEIVRNVVASISPTIFGLNTEKEALALQLFGGVPKKMPDGTKIRGDPHILIIGDPGTAKSQILRYISELAPRGIYTAGKTTSAAGLTAAAVKDDSFGEGRWVLEAGALVLADLGVACIDELDKMTKEDRSSMHEVMEQQTVSVSKAGITATLQARCTILAAANPKYGRFDTNKTITEQIELPPTLLSRFDVIFPIIDIPRTSYDEQMAEHIIQGHLVGERMRDGGDKAKLELEVERKRLEPYFQPDFLRKYIRYARSRVFPVLTSSAMDSIKSYYLDIRKQGQGENAPIPITPRQLEAIIRLSEASARMRLSREISEDDTKRAIRIVEYSLKKVATEPGTGGGILDIDIISTGRSRSQWTDVRTIKELISSIGEGERDGVDLKRLTDEAVKRGIPPAKLEATLKKLVEAGELYRPKHDRYRLASE